MRKIYILFMILLFSTNIYAENPPLRFAPLPMESKKEIAKDFSAPVSYLSKKLNRKINMVNYTNYEDILEGVKRNYIDIAYMGPLPYAFLKTNDKQVEPLVGFYEKGKSKGYKCVLVKSILDDTPKNFKNKKLALTQYLSTCGYFATQKLLKNTLSTDIENLKYRYVKKHSNVATSVLKGKYLLGGLKDTIANKYKNMGLEIVASSEKMPSFILIANKNTIDGETIRKLKTILLNTPPSIYTKWSDRFSNGMFTVDEKVLIKIQNELSKIDLPKKGNF